jgi:hypothetical protein
MRYSIKAGKRRTSWREFVDYSREDLISHLARQFAPGMSWDNYGEWHIDHIVPLKAFDIGALGDEQFRRAWALSNLRPLWGVENVRKSAKRVFLL